MHLAQGIEQISEWYLLTRFRVGDAVKKAMRWARGRLSTKQIRRE